MAKKIRLFYVSDLHFEFLMTQNGLDLKTLSKYQQIFRNTFSKIDPYYENILVIAGDLIWSKHFHYLRELLEEIATHFDKTFLILGNHDYWRSTIDKSIKHIRSFINENKTLKDKMFLLENNLVSLNQKYNIWGATLWYSAPPHEQYNLSLVMNDFKYIKTNNYRKMNYSHFELLHNASIYSLKEALIKTKEEGKKLVIATHHGTSENYLKFTPYSHCLGYATTLPPSLFHKDEPYELLDNIQCFIHGHSHVSQKPLIYENEYGIKTYMNTLGYVGHEFHFIEKEDLETLKKNNKVNNFDLNKFICKDLFYLPEILLD